MEKVLQPGESALAVFTRMGPQENDLFVLNADGTGRSGNWRLGRNRKPARFIVYARKGRARTNAKIYVGEYVEMTDSQEHGRKTGHFKNMKLVQETTDTWPEFAHARGPFRYR
jgi:hypothetical protein